MCTCRAHANTTNILSSSFSHSVELPLGFTGVVLYLHHLCETVTFTDQFRYSKMTFQIICEKAVPAHCIRLSEFFCFVMFCFVLFDFFSSLICFSPRQRLYMTVYTIQTHAFHLSPKVWVTTFSKASST